VLTKIHDLRLYQGGRDYVDLMWSFGSGLLDHIYYRSFNECEKSSDKDEPQTDKKRW